MVFKNKEFELFGTKYSIEYVNKITSEQEGIFTSGLTNSAAGTTKIAKLNYNGNPMNKNT